MVYASVNQLDLISQWTVGHVSIRTEQIPLHFPLLSDKNIVFKLTSYSLLFLLSFSDFKMPIDESRSDWFKIR